MTSDHISPFLAQIGRIYANQIPTMLALAMVFTLLAVFQGAASSPGKVWWRNPGLATDICHALANSVLGPYFKVFLIVTVFAVFAGLQSADTIEDFLANGYGPFHGLPFWWQAALYLLLADFFLYWIHRGFHFSQLWRFHAIHHSATQVDWTTSYRNHPVNLLMQQSFVSVLMLMLGISPEVMVFFVPWDVFSAAFVHANVNWTLGPLKYVIATPVFHRWHHGLPDDGGNSNFAPTFSFYDVLFGTFYMPEGRLPQTFGVDDRAFPEAYLRQLVYPFRPKAEAPAADGQVCGTQLSGRL
jgi:sterol desaturase/sphingolipid hydroxylase (fatty acid hydroxylase superfamily)